MTYSWWNLPKKPGPGGPPCEGGASAQPNLRINGQPATLDLHHGFARLARSWRKGDTVELDLPMPIRRVLAHPAVQDNVGRVALQRGPIVYCAEGVDHDGHALNLVLPDETNLSAEHHPELLGGVTLIRGSVPAPGGNLASTAPPARTLFAIPYYAWANRGSGEMTVWFARQPSPTNSVAR